MSADILADGTLQLDTPVQLPDVLDLLIVGGGPAGTAAAFRAKELGLSALVIDYDDLMKRIRDYAKDKLILPNFGGGDQMRFPAGGELVSSLHFQPIDKDDICVAWRNGYRKYCVPAKIGIELTGITQQNDGIIDVKTWNHRSQCEELIRVRHLVLSIGRGVPRRFNIPGNTDGISYRLDNAENYVGGPACVVGGGTSAAEAVIAISNAKSVATDPHPVYWSYRGDKMPKVSKALSEVFFNAYLGNGNIRYHPKSEPVAIVSGPDREEYLSIRVDRRKIEGRSIETRHLEFLKKHCIACIGEDIPEQFLNSLGIYLATGGPKNKKQMIVTQLLETQQPNVYLVGDILSQRYLETDRFDADPSTFREVKHPGNIKSALRDGVFVAEVIKQKLDGRHEISVSLVDAEDPEVYQAESPDAEDSASFIRQKTTGVSVADKQEATSRDHARIIRITQTGLQEDEYLLNENKETTIGRHNADISFPDESSLSDKHASIIFQNGAYHLRDEGSTAGSFYQLPAGALVEVFNGDLIQLGRQFLVFSFENKAITCLQYDHQGELKKRHPIAEGTIVLGRDAPDITLDATDGILSRRHLAVSVKGGRLYLKDLSSLNHTYLRVKQAYPLNHDDVFRLGQFLFQLSTHEVVKSSHVSVVLPAADLPAESLAKPEPQIEPKAAPAPVAAGNGPSVTFVGHGSAIAVTPDETVLNIARNNNVPINYECESGRCGYDPVKIISGQEHLSELDEDEEGWTLEEVCHLKPGEHRLACLLKTRGPVVVEVVQK